MITYSLEKKLCIPPRSRDIKNSQIIDLFGDIFPKTNWEVQSRTIPIRLQNKVNGENGH